MRILLFFCVALAFSQNLIGTTKYYRALKSINHLNQFNDTLVISTNAGVYIYPDMLSEPEVYTTQQGLGENSTIFTANTLYGLVSVGETGTISHYNPSNNQFDLWHTSYQSSGFNFQGNRILSSGRYLIIPFKEGLSFFDLKTQKSYLTVNKISNRFITSNPIKDLQIYDDTLAVLIDTSVYVIPFDSSHIDSARHSDNSRVNVIDPGQWAKLKTSLISNPQVILYKDSIRSKSGSGEWYFDSLETRALHWPGDTLIIDGIAIFEPTFYDTIYTTTPGDSNPVGVPHNRVQQIEKWGSAHVMSDGEKIWTIKENGSYNEFIIEGTMPNKVFHEVALSEQHNFFWSYNEVYQLNQNGEWSVIAEFPEAPVGQSEILNKRLKNLAIDPNENITTGSWGVGIKRTVNGTARLYHPILGDCLNGVYETLPNFPVVSSVASDAKGRVWFANYIEEASWNYTIGFIAQNGDMNCFENMGTGRQTAQLKFNPNDPNELAVTHYGGIDLYDISSGEPILTKSYNGSHVRELYLMTWDGQNRIWAQGADRLVLVCPDKIIDAICFNEDFKDSLIDVSLIFGVQGGGFSSIESDALGNIWIGTRQNGAYYIEASKDSITGSDIEKYTVNSGLFSNTIFDLATNNETGEVWFIHSDGITLLQTKARATDDFENNDIRVFPNPWRFGQHDRITFDRLPIDAEILLFNESRQLIKRIVNEEIVGGFYQWDLTNQRGAEIKGGVYPYIIKHQKGSQKGHLLIVK